MPKLTGSTERIKAKRLTNLYLKTGSQQRVADLEGVTKQAINQRINRAPVQKTLQETIDKCLTRAGISKTKVYKRINEQLDATRTISAVVSPDGEQKDANGQTCDFVEVPDHNSRDKAIDKCLTLMGHIKRANESGTGVKIINVVYGHRANVNDSAIRHEGRAA